MATLINGNGNLAIYAQQDADWYAALMGGQTVITAVGNQFAYELLASNTIGVKDGVIITKEGRRIQLDANAIDSFDIPTGAQGTTNYYIIGYHLVTGNQSEQTAETFVQLMENGTDTIPEGSFRDGDDEVFVSLYRVEQDDLTIGTITLLLPQLSGSSQSQISELNNDLTANTKKFKFDYDNSSQKYGYSIDGTFYPFSSGAILIGEYSANNTTVDVSDLNATDVNQFLLVPSSNSEVYSQTPTDCPYPYSAAYFYMGALSLNNNILTITLPRLRTYLMKSTGGVTWLDSSTYMKSKLYFIGNVE